MTALVALFNLINKLLGLQIASRQNRREQQALRDAKKGYEHDLLVRALKARRQAAKEIENAQHTGNGSGADRGHDDFAVGMSEPQQIENSKDPYERPQ